MFDNDTSSFWRLKANVNSGYFILDIGEEAQVDEIQLKNVKRTLTHTKEIKVFVSSTKDGPWNEIMHEVLPDTRNEQQSTLRFGSYGHSKGRFIKCAILGRYGTYAGLKSFNVYSGY